MTKISFLHPDLGIGGAERLIVDAALGLQRIKKNNVTVYTTYHDKKRCFQETVDGSLKLRVIGGWIPRTFCGLFHVVFAILRMCWAAVFVGRNGDDVFVVDQVSACIPILKWFAPNAKVVFYCHFPDKLLAQKGGLLKRMYRFIFDWIEEKTTGCADVVLVNSNFTKGIFKQEFRSLKIDPDVVYPSLDCSILDRKPKTNPLEDLFSTERFVISSINRFERKKNLMLALQSFEILDKKYPGKFQLILAGGYDQRLTENVQVKKELEDYAKQQNLTNVTFLPSFSDDEKYFILHDSDAIVYTPRNEHFGIVPIEAMYCKTCVIACNSGGPKESIVHESTGYLVDDTPVQFASAIEKVYQDPVLRASMGEAGRQRVLNRFSFQAFSEALNSHCQSQRSKST